ncbi:Extracellular lipase [Aspergillus sclerotialis]|uniref:feruloyl esterase n=1 Tax=Aspergillus sclerotialis TaxID=2070753 RepID=A0A3A2ZWE6_9EURO|nr:Extracellular lipase [Aspergillus sclerotialis]
MRLLEYACGIAALAALAAAAPTRHVPRDVSADVLQQLTLFAEYSAASYCTNNINSTGNKLSCSAGNCPMVEAATTKTLYEFEEDSKFGDVAGFLVEDSTNKLLIMAFRGSRSLSTWIANLDFATEDIGSICTGCEAHGGFWKSWEAVADSLVAQIKSAVDAHPQYTLVFTGHSFGGAMATLGATAMRNDGYKIELYTYGSPRLGNKALAEYVTSQGSLYRTTHTDDIVPKLPPIVIGFSHPSPEYWITSGDGVDIDTSDIKVIEGIDSKSGNAGASGESTSAHGWYIVDISACQ